MAWLAVLDQLRAAVVAAYDGGTRTGASQAAILAWHTRRRHMADQLGQVGAQLLEAIQRDLAERKRLNLRDAGILLGIVLDKAELLTAATGGASSLEAMPDTERVEHLQRILGDLQARKADQDG
jgi:hypothetical protein